MRQKVQQPRKPKVNGVYSKHLSEMSVSPDRPYIVKGMLLERQVSILAGPPNTGKSSVVGAILSQVSQGKGMGAMRVKKAVVFYVGAEDPDGIAFRAHGHFPCLAAKKSVEFYVHDEPIDISRIAARDDLIEEMNLTMASSVADHLLIVFDTLTLSIGDSDENLTSDMRRVIYNAQILARRTKAHVMFIHHTPTADETRLRGSSALNGNSDTVMILNAAEKNDARGVLLKPTKQRSIAKGEPVGFEMSEFDLGLDSDGDISTAPLALLAGDTSGWKPKKATGVGDKSNAELRRREVLRCLKELSDQGACAQGITAKQLASVVGPPFDRDAMLPASLSKAVREALNALVQAGDVEKKGSHLYRLPYIDEPLLEYGRLH